MDSNIPSENEVINFLSTKGRSLSKEVSSIIYKHCTGNTTKQESYSSVSESDMKMALLNDAGFIQAIASKLQTKEESTSNESENKVSKDVNKEVIMKGLEAFQ